jgi:hypothetical protein
MVEYGVEFDTIYDVEYDVTDDVEYDVTDDAIFFTGGAVVDVILLTGRVRFCAAAL